MEWRAGGGGGGGVMIDILIPFFPKNMLPD